MLGEPSRPLPIFPSMYAGICARIGTQNAERTRAPVSIYEQRKHTHALTLKAYPTPSYAAARIKATTKSPSITPPSLRLSVGRASSRPIISFCAAVCFPPSLQSSILNSSLAPILSAPHGCILFLTFEIWGNGGGDIAGERA